MTLLWITTKALCWTVQVCGRCGEEKAASEFPARKFSTSDGLHTFCRSCKAATGQSGGIQPTQEVGSFPSTTTAYGVLTMPSLLMCAFVVYTSCPASDVLRRVLLAKHVP